MCIRDRLKGMSDERQNRPILSAKIEHVLSSMILSADFLCIGQQILFMLPYGDCLQRKINTYFTYLLCLLFIFVH